MIARSSAIYIARSIARRYARCVAGDMAMFLAGRGRVAAGMSKRGISRRPGSSRRCAATRPDHHGIEIAP
mgnify:CR=1 FL=1